MKSSANTKAGVTARKDSAPAGAADAFSFLEQRKRRRFLLKVVAVLVVLTLAWEVGWPKLHSRSVSSRARARKAHLNRRGEGRGESWVLPKRWRDGAAGATTGDDLPVCKRVLLFEFSGTHGFGSEIMLYLRAQVVAQKLGYVFLSNDEHWNYGSLSEYFLPRQIHCRPSPDWFLRDAPGVVPLGAKRWTSEDRVWFGRELLDKADDWTRDELLDPDAMTELKVAKYGRILPEGATLPDQLEEVFVDFAAAAKELFSRPNDQLATMIRSQRMELGLGTGGLRNRKNSPTWGGNRRTGDTKRPAVEDVHEDDHDFDEAGGAERSDRGPLIGTYFRLDKSNVAPVLGAGSRAGDFSLAIEGATDAVRRLSKSSLQSPGYSRSRGHVFPSHATPTLVVMTSEDDVVPALLSDPKVSDTFAVTRTSSVPMASLVQWQDLLKLELADYDGKPAKLKKGDHGHHDASKILKTWNQAVFNALPHSLRVHLTRYFLRDLITLSLYADAFVVSGASHVGRLAMLIGAEDAVAGPRDISGKGLGGRIRSVDTPWYPTSSPEALFEQQRS
ncbi:hypothetical protein MNV49_007174 [Pseudohyphozyma bogoriensis]|nr:hypothetical protein MNV49_007174 [Pseudohyphozyma bogoriensis]